MANSLSAAKRARQNDKRRARNAALKSKVRTLHKSFIKAVEAREPDADEVKAAFARAVREYDRAWSRRVLKRETASRHISRLYKRLAAFEASA